MPPDAAERPPDGGPRRNRRGARRQSGRRRAALAVAAVALAAGLVTWAVGALGSLELNTIDARFQIRPDPGRPHDVALVGIDNATVTRYGRPPLPRRLDAQVIARIHAAGARVIASDLQFVGRTDPRDDQALEQAISSARPMALATQETDNGPNPVFDGHPPVAQLGAKLAAIGIPTDSDGKIRRYFYAPVELPTLAVRAAELATGRRVSQHGFPNNKAWVDYLGPPGTVPTYSFADVLAGRFAPDAFRGRVVVLGITTPIAQDIVQTPVTTTPMPGPELQATAIHTVLHHFPLRSVPGWVDVAVIVLAGLISPLVSLRGSLGLTVLALLATLAAIAVGAQLSFDAGRIVTASYPALAALVGGAGSAVAEFYAERRERRRVRELFSRFVPAEVVDQVIERTDEDLRLGGVRRECTALFCDLRGFTTFSEAQDPQRLVEIVNVYMSEMGAAILAHGGTLVSYMGDGIMALFGAPLEQSDHADRALGAARDMIGEALPRFNAWLAEQGLDHQFRMGIGLNSGQVMSGNVGSENRLEYTAMGDTVNTASRVEGLTKNADTQLLVTDATRGALSDPPADLEFVDEYPVRGRQAHVRLWTLPAAR
ncbi:MAG: adenylate/guanylate cyclase domain-containing protein [Actinobacteria bacterium]|nr:MAG: adenylate/guanylate cyclase domain-containing protein [Actinomycetota bacterium]